MGAKQVEEICALRDDVYRNQWITFAYWSISKRLGSWIGTKNANWCTFATWTSRVIGQNLRWEQPSRRVEELIADPETSYAKTENQLLLKLRYRALTRADGALPRVLALGNRLVFHEVGYAVTRFLEWAEKSTADDEWDKHREKIEPYEATDLFPAADVEQLRGGLECYYRAKKATDEEKANLVLRGNVLLVAYEQWRVDSMLKVALNPTPSRFLRVVRANPHAHTELSLPRAGTPWALRHHSPIRRTLAAQYGGAITQWVLALDVPLGTHEIRPLRVGRAIGPPTRGAPPLSVPELSDPELERLLGVYDRSGVSRKGSAARNWTRFSDRMNFIVNLFRAGQQDANLHRDLPDAELRALDLDMSDGKLDELRRVGDPEIDQLVEDHIATNSFEPRDLVQKLIARDAKVPDPETCELPPWADDEQLKAGQEFFRRYRLEIAAVLLCASLPQSYTSASGARVLTKTAELVSDAGRRVGETGQMLLNAMASDDSSRDPLRPGTDAYKAALGVRLFHGAVRRMILADPDVHWREAELGVPINQEDLLGTLAVFTVLVIESLDKMGVTCTVQDRDAYFHLWLAIGHLLGVDYDSLYREEARRDGQPLTYPEMQLLARLILDRNAEASPDGQALMTALLNVSESSSPRFLKTLPRALTRRLIGDESADMLGIPPPGPMRLGIALLRPVNAVISPYVHSNALGGVADILSRQFYRKWIKEHGGSRPPWLDPAPVRAARRLGKIAGDVPRRTRTWISGTTSGS
ncbi:MAG: oxygenase MpaB family protein [Acidimicrobiia bacterium]